MTHFANEVHRDGAETRTTAHGMGVSSLTHHLGLLLAGATLPNLATVRADRVGFGSRVLVQDLETGTTETHHIMASHAMDFGEDHVSVDSPLGAALLGRSVGDLIDVTTPSGLRRLRVMAVRSLPDLLEVLDPRTNELMAGAGR